jgi:hypothetical protein
MTLSREEDVNARRTLLVPALAAAGLAPAEAAPGGPIIADEARAVDVGLLSASYNPGFEGAGRNGCSNNPRFR